MKDFDYETVEKFSKNLINLMEAYEILWSLWTMISPYGSKIDKEQIPEHIMKRLRNLFEFDDSE